MIRVFILALLSVLPVTAMRSAEPDLSDPAVVIETWVRLKGDTAGRVTYEWVTGVAYGVPAGALSRPLFGIESVTVRQVRSLGEAGYEEQNYACRLYRDAATGEYIDRFLNPFTGREVLLETLCSPGPTIRYTPESVELVGDWKFESTALGGPMSLELIEAGDHVVIRRDAHSQYIASDSGEVRRELSIDTFKVSLDDLQNRRLTGLLPTYSWVSVTQWMTILDMGDTPGRMLWSINGRKYLRADELPARFLAALEEAVPGALQRVFDWGDDSDP
jgi:hypothetical protein